MSYVHDMCTIPVLTILIMTRIDNRIIKSNQSLKMVNCKSTKNTQTSLWWLKMYSSIDIISNVHIKGEIYWGIETKTDSRSPWYFRGKFRKCQIRSVRMRNIRKFTGENKVDSQSNSHRLGVNTTFISKIKYILKKLLGDDLFGVCTFLYRVQV